MSTRDSIIFFLDKHGSSGSKALSDHLGITRQALNIHLNKLIDEGEVTRTGATRNTRYVLSSTVPAPEIYRGEFLTDGMDEHHIYQRAALSLNLATLLKTNAETIFEYAFTEMLNNAIDHSGSEKIRISVATDAQATKADIKDNGIGVFASIAEKLDYPDEHDALLQLVKGKTTTMPAAHSGEGIFFTSKAVNCLVLRSHRIKLEWSRRHRDVFVSTQRFVKGTHVHIEVRRDLKTKLAEIFEQFAPREFDFEFSKSRVQVKLLGKKYISRSEAKRLVLNLEKFKVIELDFRSVESIGQGFADEVFRVFTGLHPGVEIQVSHTSPAVAAMIRHVSSKAE